MTKPTSRLSGTGLLASTNLTIVSVMLVNIPNGPPESRDSDYNYSTQIGTRPNLTTVKCRIVNRYMTGSKNPVTAKLSYPYVEMIVTL